MFRNSYSLNSDLYELLVHISWLQEIKLSNHIILELNPSYSSLKLIVSKTQYFPKKNVCTSLFKSESTRSYSIEIISFMDIKYNSIIPFILPHCTIKCLEFLWLDRSYDSSLICNIPTMLLEPWIIISIIFSILFFKWSVMTIPKTTRINKNQQN